MTLAATAFWQTRHETFKGDWPAHYWATWGAGHRVALMRAIEVQQPRSVYEVGCGPGANLRLWSTLHPEWWLAGSDVNPAAVEWCHTHLRPGVRVDRADMLQLPPVPTADVVTSCYALAYVPLDQLPDVLAHLWRAARVALVLAEPMVAPGAPAGPCADDRDEWRHDYETPLRALGCDNYATWPIDPPADRLNNILIARKETP